MSTQHIFFDEWIKISCVYTDLADQIWYTKIPFYHNQCVSPGTNSPCLWYFRQTYGKKTDLDLCKVPDGHSPSSLMEAMEKLHNGIWNLLISFGDDLSVPQGLSFRKPKGLFKIAQLLSKTRQNKTKQNEPPQKWKLKSSFHILAIGAFCEDFRRSVALLVSLRKYWTRKNTAEAWDLAAESEETCRRCHTIPDGSWWRCDYPVFSLCLQNMASCSSHLLVHQHSSLSGQERTLTLWRTTQVPFL